MTTLTDRISTQMQTEQDAELRDLTARILHTQRLIIMLEATREKLLHDRDELIQAQRAASVGNSMGQQMDTRA